MIVAGVDIGNSTTEVVIGDSSNEKGFKHISAATVDTTGVKGTIANITGIEKGLHEALKRSHCNLEDIELIRINEATPVIGDTAMETVTETIISDSTMIGHNPDTPAGEGLAIGKTINIGHILNVSVDVPLIVKIPGTVGYEKAAMILNATKANVVGAILEKDEAVLVYNRLVKKMPIIDEVKRLSELPSGILCALEVAKTGQVIKTLSNPYGIAKIFDLTAEETRQTIPIGKSLTGKRSGVVAKTLEGGVKEKLIKAGTISILSGNGETVQVDIDDGAKAIMKIISSQDEILDIYGDEGSYFNNMLLGMKDQLNALSNETVDIKIKDLMAIDTFIPVRVKGALALEEAMEKAVAIAAMVKTSKLPMKEIAESLSKKVDIPVEVGGIEAVMATVGSLTTKGTTLPIAILDLGGGSTDSAVMMADGKVYSNHLAGAGSFVTMMINEELALKNIAIAELIKRYPLAKVRSLYQITLENGDSVFYQQPLPPKLYGKVAILKDDELIPIESNHTLEFMVETRRRIKEKVFVTNTLRGLKSIAPNGNIKKIPNVVLVGGSALDNEIPELIQKELANYNIVVGRGDIFGMYGPRKAVAAGLCINT